MRHARLVWLLAAHALLVPLASALLGDDGLLHDVAHGLPLAAFALVGVLGTGKRVRSVSIALGLLSASAMVVHASGGATEAHFHFFLVMSVLALYEDWLPYGLGVLYVFLHHAVLGALAPADVFGRTGDPIGLAAVHAAFITAAGVANVALWRANERARAATASALRRMEIQYDVTDVLARAVDLDDAVPELLELIARRLDFRVGVLWTPDATGRHLRSTRRWSADSRLDPLIRIYQSRAALQGGEGVAGLAWERGEAVFADIVASAPTPELQDIARATGQRGAVALPIVSGEEVLGVLVFTRETLVQADRATTQLLESLTRQLALFMERVERTDEARAYRDAAMTDALTQLPNRRAWDLALTEHVAAARRRGTPLCLALLDLDRFKAYNDTHGHQAGDELLAAAAASWRAAIRTEDVLARYGGEEFALAMPACDLDTAEEVIERLRQRLPHGQSCSAGLVAWHPDETGSAALARADEALYAAKAAGRDRIIIARAATPAPDGRFSPADPRPGLPVTSAT